MPVAWNQLRKGFDPTAFTIATAAPLLKCADPWKDLWFYANPIWVLPR